MEAAATIAVLPFDNLSGDPEQAYFARGFVEDVVTELSRFPGLEVIHPQTSFSLPADRLPEDLGIGYVLRGSVRRLGEIVRVAAQLVEASAGRQIWGDRFDAPAERLLAVQDEIVARVVSALAVEIDSARLLEARRKPLASLEVYSCWLRGLDCLRRGTVEDEARARAFFDRALTLDPTGAGPRRALALPLQRVELPGLAALGRQRAPGLRACPARGGPGRPGCLVQLVLGRILLYRRQFDEAERHVDRAIALNPNDADVLAHAALCRAYLGQPEAGAALAAKAARLNPRHPDWYLACAAVPLFLLGRRADVAALGAKAPRATVDLPAYLAASHALAGDTARATPALEMFLSDFVEKITFGRPPEPGEPLRWLLHVNPFRRPEDAEQVARGLRLAGLAPDPDEEPAARALTPAKHGPPRAAFRRDGEVWTLEFDGRLAVQLTEAKGFHDLVELLAKPDTPIHCLELAGRLAEPRGADPALDGRARRELASRARELQEQIDDAGARNDPVAAERAREELDRIVGALSGALGLGGRSRRLGSAAERARSAVTWRIRNAIRKIGAAHPSLGRHLGNAVRTGTYCSYTPDRPVGWVL